MAETIPSPRRRNRDIECLRAVAVMGVIFHHMQGNLFNPGLPILGALFQHAQFWFGVDLFLAISGFVIARSLLPQMAACGSLRGRGATIVAFWIRRCWRLLPSAWLWLAVMLLAALAFNRSHVFGSVHANVMATLAGMFDFANFRFANSFFRYPYGTSFVYWSLSLEEQFYLLLPLAVLCLRKRIDVLMVLIVVAQLCVLRTPLLMSIRTDALALGVLLAIVWGTTIWQRLDPAWLLRLRGLRIIVPCAVLAMLAVCASPDLQWWRFRISAIAMLSVSLAWLASYDRDYLLPEGRIKQALVWVGARSYAIYLIHIPVYFALREAAMRVGLPQTSSLSLPTWLLAVIALGVIGLLADLNYRYLEQPLRHHGRGVARRFLHRHPSATASAHTQVSTALPANEPFTGT